jgi:hypothetical protein
MRLCAVCGGSDVVAGAFCADCQSDRRIPKAVVVRRSGVASALARARFGHQARWGPATAARSPAPARRPGTAGPAGTAARPGGLPTEAPRPPSIATPLVVLGVGMLIVLMMTVAFARMGGVALGSTADLPAGARPSAVHVDPCVLGTWQEIAHDEVVAVPGIGTVRVTGKGAVEKFRADGTMSAEPGPGTAYRATAGGQPVELVVTGTLTYRYRAADDVLRYSDGGGNATLTVKVGGAVRATASLLGQTAKPDRYTCTGDTLKQFGTDYMSESTRVSRTT